MRMLAMRTRLENLQLSCSAFPRNESLHDNFHMQ